MEKERGFYVTRKREERRRPWSPVWLCLAVFLALVLISGATRAWSQSSDSSSSSRSDSLLSSDRYSMIWDQLSQKFMTDLEEQSMQLQQALKETQTSKASSERLTPLLEKLLQINASLKSSNDDLKSYNAQIAQRMQERDEDLVAAYDDIDRLEKDILRITIAFIVALAIAILLLIILIRR